MLCPSPAPEASRMMIRLLLSEPELLSARYAGRRIMAAMIAGMSSVMMTNQRLRTRSMNSRLMTTMSLSMAGHSFFNAVSTDALDEDLVEAGLNELEPLD